MIAHTLPREITARWVRQFDQIAMHPPGAVTTADHPDGVISSVRTVESAARGEVVWMEVVSQPTLVFGAPGLFALLVAERRDGGRHGTPAELFAQEGEQLVIRERVVMGEWPAPFDVPDFIPAAEAVHAGEIVCGRWVDYGVCVDPPQHEGRCRTRNDRFVDTLAGARAEGHPAPLGGVTAVASVPAPRRPAHDTEESPTHR